MKNFFIIILLVGLFAGCEKQPGPTGPYTGSPLTPSSSGDLRTIFSNDWDNWNFTIDSAHGGFSTVFSNDWDNWNINNGSKTFSMRTAFPDDWDNWQSTFPGGVLTLKTVFIEDWDNWELKDEVVGTTYSIRTAFPDDWDSWNVYKNGSLVMTMRTDFSDDFDNWTITNYSVSSSTHKSFLLFVPVFIAAIHQQGHIQ